MRARSSLCHRGAATSGPRSRWPRTARWARRREPWTLDWASLVTADGRLGLLPPGCEALAAGDPPPGLRAADLIHPPDEPLFGVLAALIGRQHPVVIDRGMQICPRAPEGQPRLVRTEHLI